MAPVSWAKDEIPASLVPEKQDRQKRDSHLCAHGACALLFLPAFVSDPDANPPKVSVVGKTSLSQKPSVLRVKAGTPVDTGVPDAESAEVKAIRDLREVPGYSPMDAEAAANSLSQNGTKHPAISAAAGFRKAVKGAATLMSKTFQRIASEL